MRSDVHSAALRAAAKVAFSVAFIAGCSSPADEHTDGERASDDTDGVEPGSTESDIKTRKKPRAPKAEQLASACHTGKDSGAPKLTCDQVVAAAFPTEGDYPGKKQTVSAEVQTCCAELLEKSQGSLATHRWDCCANLPADAGQSVGIACTPWGPPVPPSMKRQSRLALVEVA